MTAAPDRLRRWRRRLRRHRRPLAAALTFVAVAAATTALTDDPAPPPAAAGTGTGWPGVEPDAGEVAAPVRLADADVARLLRPGDVVDVVAADAQGQSGVVADGATVLAVPAPPDGFLGSDPYAGALVVLGVPSATGVALAGAAAVGPLSLLLRR